MNYWLHRITCGDNARSLAAALFQKGYISIGWCDFAREGETNLGKIRAGGGSFDAMMESEGYGLPRNRWNLWRFVNEMRKGDLVIVPTPYCFTVCRIADDTVISAQTIDPDLLVDSEGAKVVRLEDGYLYLEEDAAALEPSNIIDLGFIRKVEILERNIPRDGYADQDLSSRMKIRQTNANIDDLAESVNMAVSAFREKKPINLRQAILDSTAKTVLDNIQKLQNDAKFELLVEWYLKAIGGSVITTPAKNESSTEDGDADKVALFDKLQLALMVQAKKHVGKTDDWAVTQIKAFARNHDYDNYQTLLWVISTCDSFSEEAVSAAAEANVRLINGPQFARMIIEAGLEGLEL